MNDARASAMRAIVRDAARLNRSGVELGFAARCTVGVATPLIVSGLTGASLAGVSAAYGALVTGMASRQGVYRTRAFAMIATALALALAGMLGALTAPWPDLNVAIAALVAAAFGCIAVLGPTATTASVNGVVAFVLFSNPPYTGANALVQAAMIVVGGLVQTLLLVAVWPLQRFRVERRALALAYRALARYAADVDADDLGLPDATSLAAARAALADPQPFGSRNELAAFEILADEAERLRATLAALTNDYHLLSDVGLEGAALVLARATASAAAVLGVLADALGRGEEPQIDASRFGELDAAIAAFERVVAPDAPSIHDVRHLAAQLRSAVRAARAAANGGVVAPSPVPSARFELATVRDGLVTLRANLTLRSVNARHALRLAAAIAAAVVVQHHVPIEHGQWIGLTVALVLRPDFSSTFTRGIGRVFGTIVGAVVASAIAGLHPPDGAYIALSIVFAAAAFALFNVSYAVFSIAITGYVVYLLAYGGLPEHAAAVDRVLATCVGGLIAALAYLTWPTWARQRVADDLAALLDAQRRYAVVVLRAFLTAPPDLDAIHDAQLESRRARSNAEASVDQMKGEPVRARGLSLQQAQGVLAASRRIGLAALGLTARIDPREGPSRAPLDRLIQDVDAALAEIAGALRSGRPPGELPPLVRDQAELAHELGAVAATSWAVLAAETDLLVETIESIADIIRRT